MKPENIYPSKFYGIDGTSLRIIVEEAHYLANNRMSFKEQQNRAQRMEIMLERVIEEDTSL